jgi:predicted oxidoreductase
MQYVNLGCTGLKVSRVCLGTMTYGTGKWRPWVLEEAESRPFLRRAVELGINFFDTADMYSLGASEEVIGRALKDLLPRDRLVLATKVYAPMGDDPNQRGLSRKHIYHAIDDSLRRLGVDGRDPRRAGQHRPRREGAVPWRIVHVGVAIRQDALHGGPAGPGALRHHAEPLQHRLPGRGA